jgi:hypothetical protein
MPKVRKVGEPVSFRPTKEDQVLIEALGVKLGQGFAGLVRYMLRRMAEAEGIKIQPPQGQGRKRAVA